MDEAKKARIKKVAQAEGAVLFTLGTLEEMGKKDALGCFNQAELKCVRQALEEKVLPLIEALADEVKK